MTKAVAHPVNPLAARVGPRWPLTCRFLHFAALVVSVLPCVGCGSGTTISRAQASVAPPDFSLQLSVSSLALSQGMSTSAVSLTVSPQNGFSGAVQVSLTGLPNGVASNPSSPFAGSVGGSMPIILGASLSAATGNFTVTATGSSGSLSHSATLALTISPTTIPPLPRSTFARTDAIPALDAPASEPPHRHIAYDSANKHVFVANRAMNRVEVFSSTDQTSVAQISVAGASSADLSADGNTVWVGTATEQAVAVDTFTLEVRSRYAIPAVSTGANAVFDRPEELLAMANGKIMMRLRQPGAPQSLLALWDPISNMVANLTSAAPALFQNGLGPMAHTGDRTKLLVAANDASGQLAVLDSSGNVLAGPVSLGAGTIPAIAANTDGSRFAAGFVSGGNSQLLLLDGSLHQVASPASLAATSLVFSRDNNFLYAGASSGVAPAISIFSAANLGVPGQIPNIFIQGIGASIEEADETHLLFATSNRGVAFLDASQPGVLRSVAPAFAAAPVLQPSEGPAVGGTSVFIAGQNFEPTAFMRFGPQFASGVTVAGTTQLQTASPPSVVNGPVNVAAYFPSGWFDVAPDGFSYGPRILKVLPNSGSNSGGDLVQIYGYGFGNSTSGVSVRIGGASAAVRQVQNVTQLAAPVGLDSTYAFPLESITVQSPSGTPGKADVVVTSPAGTASAPLGFQYLQSAQVFAKPALYKFILYDQRRQFVYLSATDHIDAFDLNAGAFKPALAVYCPSKMLPGPCPNAGLRGMALTPDGSQLLVADFGSQNVYLLNPDSPGSVSFVSVGGVPGFSASGPARVAPTSAQTVFVGMSGEGSSLGVCSGCLLQLNLAATPVSFQTAPQPQVSTLTGAPLIQASSSGDVVFLSYNSSPGPLGFWSASSPNQFTISQAAEAALDMAAAPDGTSFLSRTNGDVEIHDSNLFFTGTPAKAEIEQIAGRVLVPGAAMHPSGALLYQPFLTGQPPSAPPANNIQGGFDIIDTHTGTLRLRAFLPEPLATLSTDTDGLHGSFLAVDENGQRIFALTTSGLTILQLTKVPLGIGTISPATAPTTGGAVLTIRGSGFQSGTNVSIGGKSAAATFKDMNTLTVVAPALASGPHQMVFSNPDGETIALDAAFTAN